ncbi:hypothetical protein GGX14DRAFT_406248 [Mycena pura]|uniref:Uncharacterized protein n=1 Tax=Mycena pura TaxID=153505 RepID=A0AAD6UQL0_9AGAR|nr:hypothetical protein GGX14DRAFT_406248 [Mycena pura]
MARCSSNGHAQRGSATIAPLPSCRRPAYIARPPPVIGRRTVGQRRERTGSAARSTRGTGSAAGITRDGQRGGDRARSPAYTGRAAQRGSRVVAGCSGIDGQKAFDGPLRAAGVGRQAAGGGRRVVGARKAGGGTGSAAGITHGRRL